MQLKKYAFDCEKACRSLRVEGRELWTITLRAKHLPLELGLGPNARYASLSAKPAKDMLRTLENEPESFVFKNNGMMVIAHSLHVEDNHVELECREPDSDEDAIGHGVLNGGHTYEALKHALKSSDGKFGGVGERAFVTLTVGIGIPEEEIWKISRARNTSQPVPLYALRELAGDWSILKKYLRPEVRTRVAFKPNDPEADPDADYDVTDLVRRLALLNNEMFPAQIGAHPVSAYTSIGSLVKKYSEDKFLRVAPLLPDALDLEERVVRYWEQKRGRGEDKIAIAKASGNSTESKVLLSGYKTQITLADPFVLPVVAAFRVFIAPDGTWHKPLAELWEKWGPRTVQALWDTYKEQGKSSAAVFGRSKTAWAAVCDLTKSAAIQEGLLKIA